MVAQKREESALLGRSSAGSEKAAMRLKRAKAWVPGRGYGARGRGQTCGKWGWVSQCGDGGAAMGVGSKGCWDDFAAHRDVEREMVVMKER